MFVGVVNFNQVVLLLCKKYFGVLNGIEEIEILSVLVGFEVQVVEQLNETFVELTDFNVAGARFDLALDYCNLAVLFGKQFLLRNQLLILLFEFLVNLMKSSALLIFFNFNSAGFDLLELLVKSRFFFATVLFQSYFCLC